MSVETATLQQQLIEAIRIIPDFPQPGISFKDITPLLLRPDLIQTTVATMADHYRQVGITKVIGIESRGFLLGPMIAQALNAGFVIVRKKGKLPYSTQAITYQLEYGTATIEVHQDAIVPGDKVLIHDDLLATGGTAAAAAQLVSLNNAQIGGFCFIVQLVQLGGFEKLKTFHHDIFTVVDYTD